MNTINITIDAPELAAALHQLAQAIQGGQAPAAVPVKAAQTPQKPSAAPEKITEVSYTVEQVREALGSLSQAKGKAIARGILQQLGVRSVSDLEPGQFGQAMQLIEGANV